MALQKDILTSLHARKLGLSREGFLVGDGFQGGAIGNGQFMGALESSQTGITADTGRAQATAVPLSAILNRVDSSTAPGAGTVAGDGVALPPSVPGLDVIVINNTSNPIQVFPASLSGDAINGGAANAAVVLPPNDVAVFQCPIAGAWYFEAGIGFSGSLPIDLSCDNITAHAGGGQGSATPMPGIINRITTVATLGDSVSLPPAVPGLDLMVINHGANDAQIYGAGTDTIDDIATATGVSQMAGSVVIYSCTTAGRWYSNGLGTGYSGSYETMSTIDSLTAHAGGGQGSALPLTKMMNRVTTVASAGDSVVLPASARGMNIGAFHNTADHLMLGRSHWGVLSKDAYLANDYRQEVEVIVDREGGRGKGLYGGFVPRRVPELGIGDALAFGDAGYRRIDTLYEDWSFPQTQELYALVLGGSRTLQVAGGRGEAFGSPGGYVVSGWADDRAFDYEAWEPRT